MAFSTVLLILGTASLCAGQTATAPSQTATAPTQDVEEVKAEPVKATYAAPATTYKAPATTYQAPATAYQEPVYKSSVGTTSTVQGGRTTYTVLKENPADLQIVEDGDTVFAHAIVYSKTGSSTFEFPDYSSHNTSQGTSIKWIAGSSRDSKATSFDTQGKSHLQVGICKGIDLGMMGAKEGDIRELHVPADEAFGPGGVPASQRPYTIPAGDLIMHVTVVKFKNKERVTSYESARRLRVEAKEKENARRLEVSAENHRRLAQEAEHEARRLAHAKKLGVDAPKPVAKAQPKAVTKEEAQEIKEEQKEKKAEEM